MSTFNSLKTIISICIVSTSLREYKYMSFKQHLNNSIFNFRVFKVEQVHKVLLVLKVLLAHEVLTVHKEKLE